MMVRVMRKWLQSPVPLRLRLSLGKALGDAGLKKIFGGILVKKLVVVSPVLPTIDPLSTVLNELSSYSRHVLGGELMKSGDSESMSDPKWTSHTSPTCGHGP